MLVTSSKLCDTCSKSDVCRYKDKITKTANEVSMFTERDTKPKLRITLSCELWLGAAIAFRENRRDCNG